MNDAARPDPDELLSRIEGEDKKGKRGRLKIFFGSSAGVGKTYAMLSAAREEMEKGREVLAGIVETHGRPETERLLEGVRMLQPLEISYRGLRIREFDLETALTRKPDILLVDELAHTNAPGCRHPKRWNDVAELLDAGIDVFTTLNVQHIESLADLVAGTTGVWMKETVPDSVFDLAEDVVLVDLDEDDLIKRLNEGKVYVAAGAQARAAENFFRKNNLSALRELALRRMAERVDAEREASSASAETKVALADKILVSVGLDQLSLKLLRTTRRMAGALKAPWVALFVDDSGRPHLSEADARRLESLERMAERMGGRLLTIHGDDIADEVTSYARKHGFSKIVVGKDLRLSLRHIVSGFLVDRIIRKSGPVDIYVVTDDRERAREEGGSSFLADFALLDHVLACLILVAVTIPGYALSDILTPTDQALIYLTGIVAVSGTLGLGPSLLYALMAAFLFNTLFIGPSHTFSLAYKDYLITFLVMILTGVTIARQSSRLRAQALGARDREERTRTLYALTRRLAGARGRFPVSEIVGQYIAQAYDVDASVWMTNSEGHPAVILGNLPEETYYKDFGALQWCFENGQNAGRGTATMPSAAGAYFPLVSSSGKLGVLGLFTRTPDRALSNEEISSLETIASLLASALERVRAGEIAQQVMLEKESAKLRSTLTQQSVKSGEGPKGMDILAALRNLNFAAPSWTPSYSLTGEADAHRQETKLKLGAEMQSLFASEAQKLSDIELNRRPASILVPIKRAKDRIADVLAGRKIEGPEAKDLPDVLIDLQLVEQAMADLLAHAARRAPPDAPIVIEARRQESEILISVSDQGETVAPAQSLRLFECFLPAPSVDPGENPPPCLSVAAGIVRLHGGSIGSEPLEPQGLRIAFTLPIA